MVKDCTDDSFSVISIHDDRGTKSVSWIKGAIVQTGNSPFILVVVLFFIEV